MKFISLDLETTGLSPKYDQILEIGAILEDTENPTSFDDANKFHYYIDNVRLKGSLFAINMNAGIISKIANKSVDNIIEPYDLPGKFAEWIFSIYGFPAQVGDVVVTLAGKNVASFDLQFMKRVFKHTVWNFRFNHRTIDPAMLYTDFKIDAKIPSLDDCLKRAGINKKVTHNALEDAWDVIQVLRPKY